MKTTVNERIKIIYDRSKLSYRKFAGELEMSGTGIQRIIEFGAVPGYQTLEKILEVYPDINPGWLLSGEGEMLKGQSFENNPLTTELFNSLKEELDKKQLELEKKQQTLEWFQELIDRLFPGSAVAAKAEAALIGDSSKVVPMHLSIAA